MLTDVGASFASLLSPCDERKFEMRLDKVAGVRVD